MSKDTFGCHDGAGGVTDTWCVEASGHPTMHRTAPLPSPTKCGTARSVTIKAEGTGASPKQTKPGGDQKRTEPQAMASEADAFL